MRRLVLGCGYLGRGVADLWRRRGDEVFALTRSPARAEAFAAAGLQPLIGDVTQPDSFPTLPACETVLVAIGMDRSRYNDIREVYVGGMETILDRLPRETGQVIYISSTGVFGEHRGAWLDEDTPPDPDRPGGEACWAAEQRLQASLLGNRSTVLRLAGIYGPGRIPSRKLVEARDAERLDPAGYLNLIHRDDAVTCIDRAAEQAERTAGHCIHVSDGNPVWRGDYYRELARRLGVEPLQWPLESEADARGKRIGNRRLVEWLNPSWRYPDYRAGLAALLPGD